MGHCIWFKCYNFFFLFSKKFFLKATITGIPFGFGIINLLSQPPAFQDFLENSVPGSFLSPGESWVFHFVVCF